MESLFDEETRKRHASELSSVYHTVKSVSGLDGVRFRKGIVSQNTIDIYRTPPTTASPTEDSDQEHVNRFKFVYEYPVERPKPTRRSENLTRMLSCPEVKLVPSHIKMGRFLVKTIPEETVEVQPSRKVSVVSIQKPEEI